MAEKPILFNTEMVRAILDGRKRQTRRIIKPVALSMTYEDGSPARKPPYKAGDVLWVRETWKQETHDWSGGGYALTDGYLYRADEPQDTTGMMVEDYWHPSIHMPRKAARLFLRVKNVRVERLQDMSEEDVCAEGAEKYILGCQHMDWGVVPPEPCFNSHPCSNCIIDKSYQELFGEMVWNSTIKKADLPCFGWDANPWVWVIEFERVYGGPFGPWADRDTAQYADAGMMMPAI